MSYRLQLWNNKKVLFLLPGPYIYEARCQAYVGDKTLFGYREPIEELYAAAVLTSAGFECKIIHAAPERKTLHETLREIKEFSPGTVIISTSYPSFEKDIVWVNLIKNISHHFMTIVHGGQMAFLDRISIMKRYPKVDVLISGEIEFVIRNILCNEKTLSVSGISYRQDDSIIDNEKSLLLESNLDELPFPARQLIDKKLYKAPDTGDPMATILASRGCQNHCSFCLAPSIMGRSIRLRTVDSVIDEINLCQQQYHIENFLIHGANTTASEEWFLELCHKTALKVPPISWLCNSRADALTPTVIKAIKESGGWGIGIGAESINAATIEKMNKKIAIHDIIRAVEICREHGVFSLMYFMIGFPWETKEDILETLEFAEKIKSNAIEIFFPYPYPGTELYSMAKAGNLLQDESPPQFSQIEPVFIPRGVSREWLIAMRNKYRKNIRRNINAFYFLSKRNFSIKRMSKIMFNSIRQYMESY